MTQTPLSNSFTLAFPKDSANPTGGGGSGLTKHEIIGSGFGAGAEILLFDRFDGGADGDPIDLASPYIGSWFSQNIDMPTYYEDSGRQWMTTRKVADINVNSLSRTALEWRAGQELTEFRMSFRLLCPTGQTFIGVTEPNGTNNSASNHKYVWLGRYQEGNAQGATGGEPDLVIPTNGGAGNTIFYQGNNVQPIYYDVDPINGDYVYTGRDGVVENLYSYYQKPETSDNARDGIIENNVARDSGLGVSVRNECNIWVGPQGPITTESFNMFVFSGWLGNSGAAGYIGAFPLMTDAYCATGPNSRARIILSDASTLALSTQFYEVPHNGWEDTKVTYYSKAYEDLGFQHLELSDGTFLENV